MSQGRNQLSTTLSKVLYDALQGNVLPSVHHPQHNFGRPALSISLDPLGVVRIRKVKDGRGVRLGTTSVLEVIGKVDGPVEAQAAVIQNVDVQGLEIGGGVDQSNVAGLQEVVGDDDVLLIRCDLDEVRADRRLVHVRIIQTLRVAGVGDVEGGDVVTSRVGDLRPVSSYTQAAPHVK